MHAQVGRLIDGAGIKLGDVKLGDVSTLFSASKKKAYTFTQEEKERGVIDPTDMDRKEYLTKKVSTL